MCFITAILLFPHYQWLGREKLGATNADLTVWVVAQNISVGAFSPLIGMVADRRGNRLATRIVVLLSALTPLLAVVLTSRFVGAEAGRRWYWLTFALLGLCPLTLRTLSNYTLELVEDAQHSRYLSTMTVCFAVPFVFAPLVGWLVDALPYQWSFIAVSATIAAGGVLTWWMPEPREGRV
jgi:MFS family permease